MITNSSKKLTISMKVEEFKIRPKISGPTKKDLSIKMFSEGRSRTISDIRLKFNENVSIEEAEKLRSEMLSKVEKVVVNYI